MQLQAVGSSRETGSRLSARSERIAASLLALLLGTFLVWGVGFSPIAALHNAAHDTRHSMAFPCH